ncbi:MAG: GNAT family N-acetyltransferase [Bacteroides sp.]
MKIISKVYDILGDDGKFIRQKVFCEEQGFINEFDEIDKTAKAAWHLVLYDNTRPAATARLICKNQKEGRYIIGRVAVLMEYRKLHLGSRLVEELEGIAVANGATVLEVSAQCRAKAFYEKCGFAAQGSTYEDEGCPHIKMVKKLV